MFLSFIKRYIFNIIVKKLLDFDALSEWMNARWKLIKNYLRIKLSRVGAAAAYAESAAAYADAAAAYADAAATYARTVKIKPNSLELSLQAVQV